MSVFLCSHSHTRLKYQAPGILWHQVTYFNSGKTTPRITYCLMHFPCSQPHCLDSVQRQNMSLYSQKAKILITYATNWSHSHLRLKTIKTWLLMISLQIILQFPTQDSSFIEGHMLYSWQSFSEGWSRTSTLATYSSSIKPSQSQRGRRKEFTNSVCWQFVLSVIRCKMLTS